jgi:two-component system, sensor histidine kinase and response regulator
VQQPFNTGRVSLGYGPDFCAVDGILNISVRLPEIVLCRIYLKHNHMTDYTDPLKHINNQQDIPQGIDNIVDLQTADEIHTPDVKPDDPEVYYLALLHNLQEKLGGLKKLAEQQSKEKSEIIAGKNKLFSIIAHDLRGPISSMMGVFNLLKELLQEGNHEDLEEYIDIGSISATNTSNLLENLLAWYAAQDMSTGMQNSRIYLARLVNNEINDCYLSARLKNILITNSISDSLRIWADEQMVKTIFRNLISNAVKFTRHGGSIRISAEIKDNFAEVVVKDNGKGIDLQRIETLFSLENSCSNKDNLTSSKRERGHGLGLMLCKEFVEKHGGTIRVDSIPEKGSSFIFTLPIQNGQV